MVIEKLKERKFVLAAIRFRRALAAALTVPVLLLLHKAGVAIDQETVQVLVDGSIVASVIYFVPSGKPLVEDEQVTGGETDGAY